MFSAQILRIIVPHDEIGEGTVDLSPSISVLVHNCVRKLFTRVLSQHWPYSDEILVNDVSCHRDAAFTKLH